MDKRLIYIIAGARPNFMKIAPIVRAFNQRDIAFDYSVIHTGQHYDREMSEVFFEELGIPEPDYRLESGGGTHAEQTAKIMVGFERICTDRRPDCVLVVGDVNSTLACTITAKKMQIPVAHIEAGLRSGDKSMPEEINRLVTDSIADWFFCTEPAGVENLLTEGKSASTIFDVGHVMVDNLFYQRDKLGLVNNESFKSTAIKKRHSTYGVVTLHRPSNVDNSETLVKIFRELNIVALSCPLVFPVHPRTLSNLKKFDISVNRNIELCGPLPYMDFLNLWIDSAFVLTDSGGLQEETTALGIPCLTLRENTERPITLSQGTNKLVRVESGVIIEEVRRILLGKAKLGTRPKLWDGFSAERIVNHLEILLK